MANSWFRLYHEFATDPKIQMLSEANQRRFIMLLCHRCNGHVTLQDDEVTFLLRISNEEWQVTKSLFIEKDFINEDNEILNWDKRQFTSDSSAERVAKHRAKKKQQCNVTVTPPDTDTDTDTDTDNKKKYKKENPDFVRFWDQYPKKVAKKEALKAWEKIKPPIEKILKSLSWQTKSEQWAKGFAPHPTTYLNQARWEDEEPPPVGRNIQQIDFKNQPRVSNHGQHAAIEEA